MKKNIIKNAVLFLLMLLPIGVCNAAIKTDSIDLFEAKSGYRCYFLAMDAHAEGQFHLPVYTNRVYGAETYSLNSQTASENPQPRCYDSTMLPYFYVGDYNNPIIESNSCKVNMYNTKLNTDRFYIYNSWNSGITESSPYTSSPADCIAAATYATTDSCSGSEMNTLLMEVKSNTDFYSTGDTNWLSSRGLYEDIYVHDSEFCFAAGPGSVGNQNSGLDSGELLYFFGRPYFTINFGGTAERAGCKWDEYSNDPHEIKFYTSTSDEYEITIGTEETDSILLGGFPDSSAELLDIDDISSMDNQDMDGKIFFITQDGKPLTDKNTCLGLAAAAGTSMVDPSVEDPIAAEGDEDFEIYLGKGYKKKQAINACTKESSDPANNITDGQYHCYSYLHNATDPVYNTTVWTNQSMSCGFQLRDWDYETCKNSDLGRTFLNEVNGKTYKMTHSGYNGNPDFYNFDPQKVGNITCNNFRALHLIYRAATIIAPILTIFFVTFDFVKSIISGDPKKVSKFRSQLIRRIIALLLLITIPIVINILIGTLSKNDKIKDNSLLKCVIVGKD